MRRGALVLALMLLWGTVPASAQPRPHWVAAWATAQMAPSGDALTAAGDLADATLRQVVRVSLGGRQLRVRLSNAFGNAPLAIDAASVARSVNNRTSRIDAAALHRLRFNGSPRVTIPAGAEYWSDPVALPVKAGDDLAISLYLPSAPDRQTGHPGARATSYLVHGDQVAAAELAGAKTITRWLVIGGVEVDAPGASALVILGDSITDGYGVPPDTNQRWPDALMARMRADPATRGMAVLNAGIGGNRLRLDGLGPNALARFEREILAASGVSHLIVLEGINDLGTLTRDAPATPEQHAALVREMVGVLQQIATRARAKGIKVIGGTIMPDGASGYYHPDAANEADRAAVNAWIRAPGNFDAVIDFDAAMRDPANPNRLRADLDSGDGLHPSMAGYRAMAALVPLSLLSPKSRDRGRAAAPRAPAPAIAFTFDDLPSHAALPPGVTRIDVANRIIAALKAAHAPATGFINGSKLAEEPASAPVLDAWRRAGLPLGNHGWRHAALGDLTDAQFVEELVRNEPVLAAKMGKGDWHWFRYPFLAEGDGARRTAVRRLLAARGYKVAAVTMGFDDWAYNDAYARCAAKGDQSAIAQMEAGWLAGAEAQADRARAMSQSLYGRDIPYVLLMHLGAFDARMLPKLTALYVRKGFRFVTLAEAERDPHYRADVDPALPPGPPNLEAALAAQGKPVPPAPQRPPLETMCR
ncbi:GDSL-type esterase/lipase family protein [Sphingomonas sp. MMS12-HWE2-04]|uniref:GDSL-type esterase/lipase family protein n=1 Tax=Sphingomonas sp. MMS12-HWE2-04 TaxID=3234199 RepID=UPI00384C1E2A